MKRVLVAILMVLCGAAASRAQQTVVTATITDPNGTAYQFGTGFGTLVCPGNQQPSVRGAPVPRTITIAGLDGFGAFTQKFYDVNVIDQVGCGYRFSITDQTTIYSFNTALLFGVTGSSVNLSAQISAYAVLLPIPGQNLLTRNNIWLGTNQFNLLTTFLVLPSFPSQSANTFFAAPNGAPGVPSFRAVVGADVPAISLTSTGNGGVSSSGTTPGHLAVYAAGGQLADGGAPAGGGTVTSVGLALPPQYNVSGTPVTGSGTLAGQWNNQYPNTVLAGPGLNSIGGIFDGSVTGIAASSTTLPLTLKPNTATDWAFFLAQTAPGISQASPIAMTGTGTWVNVLTNGNGGALFQQSLSSSASLTATGNLPSATSWAGEMFFLSASGAPSVVQKRGISGGLGSPVSLAFTTNTTIGNSILVTLQGVPPSAGTLAGTLTDSQGNFYTPIGTIQNGAAEFVMAWMAANISGATLDNMTYTCNNNCGVVTFGLMEIMELANITASTGQPTFQPIANVLANSTAKSVQAFTSKNLAGDVAVTANVQATIDSITVTMPSTGGPWRVQVAYDYFFSGGVNGECFVTDGTNTWALMEWQPLSNIGSCQNTQWSNVTYGNGASVTFTVNVFDNGATTVKATSTFHAATPSYMQVAIFSTN